ncbi:heme exporter protein CcmD [Phreatobacter sp.]|uniref:heme exporter protein CcmD n=1 Tax=Phreatobacter sp. TaxID=1966341 RepID=UPI003F6FE62D
MDMFGLGPHSGFIIASYAVTVLTCLALIGWVMIDHRRQRTTLAELERRGVTRRAGRSEGAPS